MMFRHALLILAFFSCHLVISVASASDEDSGNERDCEETQIGCTIKAAEIKIPTLPLKKEHFLTWEGGSFFLDYKTRWKSKLEMSHCFHELRKELKVAAWSCLISFS